MNRGRLFIVSAASGTGKSSLIRESLKSISPCELSVSYTTRLPREGEEHGKHYFFVSKEEFKEIESKGDFLEHAIVCLLYTSPSPRDKRQSRMPSSA